MNKVSKLILVVMLLISSTATYAGGYGAWATPTRIDVERGNGFMFYGAFGNPNNCSSNTRFYVPISHPQYEQIYALVLAAFTSGKQVLPYFDKCDPVMWYSAATVTYNYVTYGSVSIQNAP